MHVNYFLTAAKNDYLFIRENSFTRVILSESEGSFKFHQQDLQHFQRFFLMQPQKLAVFQETFC